MTARAPRLIVGVDGTEGSVEALRWAAHEAARRSWPAPRDDLRRAAGGRRGRDDRERLPSPARPWTSIVTEHEAVNQRAVNLARSFGLDIDVTGETVLGAPAYALVGASHRPTTSSSSAPPPTPAASPTCSARWPPSSPTAPRARSSWCTAPTARDAVIGRIAVGVDGSPGSDAALAVGHEEAMRCDAELVLVHGWSYPYHGPRTGISEPRDDMRLDAMRTLEASAAKVHELAPDAALPLDHQRAGPGQGHHRRRQGRRPRGRRLARPRRVRRPAARARSAAPCCSTQPCPVVVIRHRD